MVKGNSNLNHDFKVKIIFKLSNKVHHMRRASPQTNERIKTPALTIQSPAH